MELYLFSKSSANRISKLPVAAISTKNTAILFNLCAIFQLRSLIDKLCSTFSYQFRNENRTVFIVFVSGILFFLDLKIFALILVRIKKRFTSLKPIPLNFGTLNWSACV